MINMKIAAAQYDIHLFMHIVRIIRLRSCNMHILTNVTSRLWNYINPRIMIFMWQPIELIALQDHELRS